MVVVSGDENAIQAVIGVLKDGDIGVRRRATGDRFAVIKHMEVNAIRRSSEASALFTCKCHLQMSLANDHLFFVIRTCKCRNESATPTEEPKELKCVREMCA